MRAPIVVALLGSALLASPDDLLNTSWQAKWIVPAGAAPFDYGVYHLRRTFTLAEKPREFVVHVSADNRYELFANGQRASLGPARGDLFHWRYDTVDLAPMLHAGRNVLAALVWNFGDLAPEAQTTHRTGFLLQGETEHAADTGAEWKGIADRAYSPIEASMGELRGY